MFFNQFVVFAHRGASGAVLENTLESFRLACQRGVKAVEFDIMLTCDGVPVVFHDETLTRLAGVDRRVDDVTFEELKKIPLKGVYAVPSLAEVLDLLKTYYTPMNIEIKPSRPDIVTAQATTRAVVAALEEKEMLHAANTKVLISSFSKDALSEADVLAPHLEKALLTEKPTAEDFEFAHRLNAVAVHIPVSFLTKDVVSYAKERGLNICVYTINDPLFAKKAQAYGVSGIFTDNAAEIEKVLRGE